MAAALFLLASFQTLAQGLNDEFKSLVSRAGIGPVREQAYCYAENGKVSGFQTAKLQRIASLSKIFSTFLVSETTDLHKTYLTKIFIGKDSLHIEGSRDPYFEEEKLLLLFKALNTLGYKSFKKVTFSSKFQFYDIALGEFEKVTPEKTRVRLAYYLNQRNMSFIRSKWASIRKFAQEEGVELDSTVPMLRASAVEISEGNPLIGENPAIYLHRSKKLHQLLKTMNVQSKNYVAENVYDHASESLSMENLLISKSIDPATFKIYNGSGLPIIGKEIRLDNLASCETVLKVIAMLSQSLKKHKLIMSDVMAVNGGKDFGSFRERFKKFPELNDSVVSKTGTLKHTSSLAGVLMIQNEVPFAVLNHTTGAASARVFQDLFVSRMFDFIGPATPLEYLKISIFPWDDSPFFSASR